MSEGEGKCRIQMHEREVSGDAITGIRVNCNGIGQ